MKGTIAALLALTLLGTSLAVAGIASAQGDRDLTPVVEQGSTERLGGGDWIGVRAGDARVGVVYGTAAHPNKLYVFAEYKRFLGGADIYDEQGNYLATRGIPVFTIFGQSFDGLIEFQDRDGNGLINLARYLNDTTRDLPEKAMHLLDRAWTATTPTIETSNGTTWVNFTVSTANVPYEIVWEQIGSLWVPRHGRPADGALDTLAFTFHLKVDVRDVQGQVPWWKVSVSDGSQRTITHVEFLENRTYSGQAVAMGAKYDHLIQGWDFAQPADRLALETRAFVGYFVPQAVGQFIHAAWRTEARDDSGYRHRANDTYASDPRLLTRDVVYFDDNWERVGRLVWQSDVLVDGRTDTMNFQVQGGELFRASHYGQLFEGFAIIGAYVYPAGATIEHDPGLEATSDLWTLPEALNLTPITVLALQVLIVGIAMGPAILLRVRGRRAK